MTDSTDIQKSGYGNHISILRLVSPTLSQLDQAADLARTPSARRSLCTGGEDCSRITHPCILQTTLGLRVLHWVKTWHRDVSIVEKWNRGEGR